jgi:hypothetical protein
MKFCIYTWIQSMNKVVHYISFKPEKGTMTFSIMTFSIKTLSIKGLFVTLSITTLSPNDTQHNSTLSVIMLNVAFYLLLCWVLLCWMSLSWVSSCWMSWRQKKIKYGVMLVSHLQKLLKNSFVSPNKSNFKTLCN